MQCCKRNGRWRIQQRSQKDSGFSLGYLEKLSSTWGSNDSFGIATVRCGGTAIGTAPQSCARRGKVPRTTDKKCRGRKVRKSVSNR